MIGGSQKISPNWFPKIAEQIEAQNPAKFPKPAKWNREASEKSTEAFARYRLNYFADMADKIDPERKLFNPILDYFVKEYPLPLGPGSIYECYMRNGWDDGPREIMPSPLVEKFDAYAGLAQRFESEKAIGWFLGLVQPYNLYTMPEKDRESLPLGADFYWAYHMEFIFVEGMVLLEGSLDESVIRQLKDYEKYYNKNILGKIVVGRPQSNIQEWIEKVRPFFLQEPDLTQEKLAEYLDVNITSVKKNRIKAGFKTYDEFRKSFKNP